MSGRLGVQRGRRSARLGGGYKTQVLSDAPLLFLRLDETSGTSMVDSSGNGHTGTMNGSNFSLNQPGAVVATDPGAKSVKWTGASTYISIPTGSWMDVTTAATWELWINPVDNSAGNNGVISRFGNSGGGSNDWLVWYGGASGTSLEMRILIGGSAKNMALNYPQLNVWSHLAFTYNNTSLIGYVNGQQVGTTAATGSVDSGACNIVVGGYQDSGHTIQNHYLDEIAFYGTALSAARILAHYNAGIGAVA